MTRYYAWLTRFEALAAAVGGRPDAASLTVHRRLTPPLGAAASDGLHARLAHALAACGPWPAAPTVLDAGCGLGGTAFFLHARLGARVTGITLSQAQCDRASREARRRGVADACRFLVRSYDDPLGDLFPEGVDLVVAIESLAHAPDPAATIAHLAGLLAPGGRVAIVDDMPTDDVPADDADLDAFRRGWMCPAPAPRPALIAALTGSGLVLCADEDLTPHMRLRAPAALAWRSRAAGAAAAVLAWTPARVLLRSWTGGLALERLYARGRMQYRLLVAARPAAAGPPAS